jgi:RND family efflux transporter MFP subunit
MEKHMKGSVSQWFILFLVVLTVSASPALADETVPWEAGSMRIASTPQEGSPAVKTEPLIQPEDSNLVNAVIYPFQSATLGSEVRGIVDVINFNEGEPVPAGAVVAEISKAKYEAIYGEFKSNEEAIDRSLEEARKNLKVQEQLYDNSATTMEDVEAARFQAHILEARYEEAKFKTAQASLNLQACRLKAPFSGSVAVRYRDPHETVDYLEKVLEIVDTSQVYARANWPEARIPELALGKDAVFHYRGKTWKGKIAKIASLIDPASKSKRVHILLENPDKILEVGMSGSVELEDSK